MELIAYIYINRLTIGKFSKKIGMSRTHLSACLNQSKEFSERIATIIEHETNNQVTKEEVLKLNKVKS